MSKNHQREEHDFILANKSHFDSFAHELGPPYAAMHPNALERARRVVTAMITAWPDLFDEDSTLAMDYACGTGAVSMELCQHVSSVVGVDISHASVEHYNARASLQGLAPSEMRAVCADLLPGELAATKFDLVVCCASYHHFPSLGDTTRAIAAFLKPGGSLLVADIQTEADGRELFPAEHHHIVPHRHGLSQETMRAAFDEAGLVGFDMREGCFRAKMRATGEQMQWFVVRGVKAEE